MKAVTGVFHLRLDAEHAVTQMRSLGVPENKITLLTPDKIEKDSPSVPSVSGEQPGIGKAIGSVVGAVTGFSGGALVMAAIVPGIGLVTAIGLLGGAVLAAAGASIGAVAGGKLENSMTEGLPEDELFVYEDALRKGRTVVIALSKTRLRLRASVNC